MADGGQQTYLEKLYQQALQFNDNPKMNTSEYLYRNKDKKYFDDIKKKGNIMLLTPKDNNGDPKNKINKKLSGVFFCANLKCGKLPPTSPFGEMRVIIPIKYMMENMDDDVNLYFADFYCMSNKEMRQHYVTIVMTKNGSVADQSCKDNLPPLPADNPFFKIPSKEIKKSATECSDDSTSSYESAESSEKTIEFEVSTVTWVEIFYTKELDLSNPEEKGIKYLVCQKSPHVAGGKTKNAMCKICNVIEDEEPSQRLAKMKI